MTSTEEIENRMGYHRATFPADYQPGLGNAIPLRGYAGDEAADGSGMATGPLHAQLRHLYIDLAHEMVELVPEGRERSLAMTKLQESLMWANAGVAMTAPLIEE